MDELTEARLMVEMAMLPSIVDCIQRRELKELEQNIAKARMSLKQRIKDSTNIDFHIILARINNNRLFLKLLREKERRPAS